VIKKKLLAVVVFLLIGLAVVGVVRVARKGVFVEEERSGEGGVLQKSERSVSWARRVKIMEIGEGRIVVQDVRGGELMVVDGRDGREWRVFRVVWGKRGRRVVAGEWSDLKVGQEINYNAPHEGADYHVFLIDVYE